MKSLHWKNIKLGYWLDFAFCFFVLDYQWLNSRHVFINFSNMNNEFFYQILYNICFDFCKCSKLRKIAFFDQFVFCYNWELLVFVDSFSENSWKHVLSSIIVCQWRNIAVYNVWQKSDCQSTIYLCFGNCSCGLGIWHWQVFY